MRGCLNRLCIVGSDTFFGVHHPLISKKASFVLSTVGTSTDLSRYLFPRSQEVSGKKRQA